MTDFERQLQGQHFREFARHWRDEILVQAQTAARMAERNSAGRSARPWKEWFWPSPIAWGALAALWTLLFAFSDAGRPAATDFAALSKSTASIGRNATLFALQTREKIDALLAIH
ncbi:MAG: hypothetical protein V4710_11735 [Verrucomicrobiota bacterium]